MSWVALITWLVTAGFGFYMLTTWARAGGVRAGGDGTSHFRPPVVFGHFGLAAAGLVIWIIYLVIDSHALTWIAFVDLIVVAVLGDVLVLRWLRDRREGPAASPAVISGEQVASGSAAASLAEQRIPTAAVATHGVFAVVTVVLVLLVALGIGS